MQDRIEALSAQVRTLQCLAAEKEVFYSEKLESLLIQHTTGNVQVCRGSGDCKERGLGQL